MSIMHIPPSEGKSVWIANNEFVTFKATGKDTGEAFALVEVVGLPESGPPPHIHHRVDETYCLLEGELEVLDGENTFTARAGAVFYIPKGTLHAWRNATAEPARALLFIVPAGVLGEAFTSITPLLVGKHVDVGSLEFSNEACTFEYLRQTFPPSYLLHNYKEAV